MASGNETKQLRVLYFASLRDHSGRHEEERVTSATTARELYDELRAQYGFPLCAEHLRVAIDESFAAWEAPLASDQTVVFIPPVAGG